VIWFVTIGAVAAAVTAVVATGREFLRLQQPSVPADQWTRRGPGWRQQGLSHDEIVRLLGDLELFRKLDEATVEDLASRAVVQSFERDQPILAQDTPGDQMFVLASGVVRLIARSESGEVVELARLRPPAVFGEVAVLDGGLRSASAIAVEPGTLVALSRDDLMWLLHLNPDVAHVFLGALGALVRRADRQLTDLVRFNTMGKIAKRLLELADEDTVATGLHIQRVTVAELAEMVGSPPQSVEQALHLLESRRVISTHGETIEILDPSRLRGEAESTATA